MGGEGVSFADKLLSGAVAGIAGTLVIFPIDSIKTRLQSGALAHRNLSGWQCLKSVLLTSGPRGLYRGLSANLIGVTPEKAIKLAVNSYARERLLATHGSSDGTLPLPYGMLAGALAGLCQVVITNPMEMVKIKMQLQSAADPAALSALGWVQRLGVAGLYRGTAATLCRDIPFSTVFFSANAALRELLVPSAQPVSDGPQVAATLAAAIVAGIIGSLVATPMDVVKTRMQAPATAVAPSMAETYRAIIAAEGPGGLFRGAAQRCFIVAPLFGIAVLTFEVQQFYLRRHIE